MKDLWYERACPETFIENCDSALSLNKELKQTNRLEYGNYIVFSDGRGNMVHIGVMLDEDSFIHADIGGVRVTRLEDYYRKNWKVYKWQQ